MRLLHFIFLIALTVAGCANSQTTDPIPEHKTFTIASKILNEDRVINVWTPQDYENSEEKLPVLYMADGGIEEDFPHIANTLADLISRKKITPVILVGIENTERRRDLTGPTDVASDKKIAPIVGGSEQFRNFIKVELFPQIDSKYRTSEEKGIIGESASGLFVTETFLHHPEMFDFYIAFDPSLWWNDNYLVRTAAEHLTSFPEKEIRFWFAGSGAKDVAPHTKKLAKILEERNISHLKWHYAAEPKEKHGSIFRAAKEKALLWTLGN